MFLIFDTETTGLPLLKNAPLTNFDNWPRMVQIAWQLHDELGNFVESQNHIVRPDGFEIPINAKMVHGISTEYALEVGEPLGDVLDKFLEAAKKAKYLVGHNINFDLSIVGCEFLRNRGENPLPNWKVVDTCTEKTANYCQFPGGSHGKFKFPKLIDFHKLLFGTRCFSHCTATAAAARTLFTTKRTMTTRLRITASKFSTRMATTSSSRLMLLAASGTRARPTTTSSHRRSPP